MLLAIFATILETQFVTVSNEPVTQYFHPHPSCSWVLWSLNVQFAPHCNVFQSVGLWVRNKYNLSSKQTPTSTCRALAARKVTVPIQWKKSRGLTEKSKEGTYVSPFIFLHPMWKEIILLVIIIVWQRGVIKCCGGGRGRWKFLPIAPTLQRWKEGWGVSKMDGQWSYHRNTRLSDLLSSWPTEM